MENGDHKAARACEQCYETVFPIMNDTPSISGSTIRMSDGITGPLSSFQEWRSVPVPDAGEDASSTSSTLLAVDLGPQCKPFYTDGKSSLDGPGLGRGASPRVRIKSPPRSGAYHQILERFNEGIQPGSGSTPGQRSNPELSSAEISGRFSALTVARASDYPPTSISTAGEPSLEIAGPTEGVSESPTSPGSSPPPMVRRGVSDSPKRQENTVKKKRFSMVPL